MKSSKGFTLIEILIVIVLLGILAVAVLSAINPLEQIRKGRDSTRKSDAAELLNAFERNYTSFGTYPWTSGSDDSLSVSNVSDALSYASTLAANEEIKAQFMTRDSVVNGELCLSADTGGLVSVCFAPESKNAQLGGLGSLMLNPNNSGASVDCGTYTYAAGCGGACER